MPCHGQEALDTVMMGRSLERLVQFFADRERDSVLSFSEHLLSLSVSARDTFSQLNICLVRGLTLRELNREVEAAEVFGRGAALGEAHLSNATEEERRLTALHLSNLANVCYDIDRKKECPTYARRAVRIAKTVHQRAVHAIVMPYAGRLLLLAGYRKEAVPILLDGLDAARASRVSDQQLICLSMLAKAEDEDSQPELADNQWLQQAAQVLPLASDPFARGTYYLVAGKIKFRAGKLHEAYEDYAQIVPSGALDHVSKEDMKRIVQKTETEEQLRDSLAEAYLQLTMTHDDKQGRAGEDAAQKEPDGAANYVTDEEMKRIVHSIESKIQLRDSLSDPNKQVASGDRSNKVWWVVAVAVILLFFAAYVLWQRRQLRRSRERSRRKAEQRYMDGMERERQRMARELHDGVANDLLALQMRLGSDGLTPETMQQLNDSREEVRRVSHDLLPPEFDVVTLCSALGSYATKTDGVGGCAVTFVATPADAMWKTLEPRKALDAYRIAQEAVSNALKHAGATTIAIGLHWEEDDTVELTVSDDGQNGLQPSDIKSGGAGCTAQGSSADEPAEQDMQFAGIGTATMRQRAETMGGDLKLISHAYGTTLRLTFHAK